MAAKKSAFDTPWFNSQGNDFFNQLNKSKVPHLVLTAETEDFDEEVIQQFRDEGFEVAYVPLLNGGNDFVNRVHRIGEGFGISEYYGIVAFGDAASLMLEAHIKPNNPRLVAVIAYYPSAIPPITTKFPQGTQILVHLAGPTINIRHNSEVLGIQTTKKRTTQKRIEPGAGHSGYLDLAFKTYSYSACEPGFAEHDLDEYDPVAESLTFTRTLATLRRAFRIDLEATSVVEKTRDAWVDATLKPKAGEGVGVSPQKFLRSYAHILHVPTLTGGIGSKDLARFYTEFFTPASLPPSFTSKLLSRTLGTDRVVDELYITFTHTHPIAWLLPGIPPTNKTVEVALVSIMCVRGGKLESERLYWDQGSVLVQIGLIDANYVPGKWKQKGVKRLPLVGVEGARAVRRGSSREVNFLVNGR